MIKETKDLILRMPVALHKKVGVCAKKEDRSLNNMIIQLLKKALDS